MKFIAEAPSMRKACDQGMQLEPKNAFFPAVGAAVAAGAGDREAALGYLARAGECPAWDDHAADLTAVQRRTMLWQFGYKGWNAWQMLRVRPHLWRTDLTTLGVKVASFPIDEAGIQARSDLIHIAELAYEGDSSGFGDLSSASGAASIVKGLATYGPLNDNAKLWERRETQQRHISELSKLVSPKSVADTEQRLREVLAAGDFATLRANPAYDLPPDPYIETGDVIYHPITQYGVGAMVLAAFAAMIVLILVSQLLCRLPKAFLPPPALPGLASGLCFFACLPFLPWEEGDGQRIIVEIGLFYLLLAGMALHARLRWPAFIAGAVLPPAMITYLELNPVDRHDLGLAFVPAGLFIAFEVRHRTWRSDKPATFFLAPFFCATMFGLLAIPLLGPFTSYLNAIGAMALMLLTLYLLVAAWQVAPIAEAARQVRRYATGLAALAAVGFGGAVMWQTIADRYGMAALRQEESLSPVIRKWAREHPDDMLDNLKKEEEYGITHGGWP